MIINFSSGDKVLNWIICLANSQASCHSCAFFICAPEIEHAFYFLIRTLGFICCNEHFQSIFIFSKKEHLRWPNHAYYGLGTNCSFFCDRPWNFRSSRMEFKNLTLDHAFVPRNKSDRFTLSANENNHDEIFFLHLVLY